MTVAALSVSALPLNDLAASEIAADVLVIGVLKTGDGPRLAGALFDSLQSSLASVGATGGSDELLRLPAQTDGGPSIALIGLGSAEPSVAELRYAAGSAARQLRGVETIALALPTATDDDVLAVLEGAAIGAYSYTTYRSASLGSTKTPASTIAVHAPVAGDTEALVERATAVAAAVHTVRDLVNMPPSDLYPESFANLALDLASDPALTVTVLDEAALAEGGFGGILGVGQGSSRGPRLVKVEYSPAGADKHLAFVGKGITFDTGGLSLKPPGSMIGMKYDMTGAATVLAVTVAAARLQLRVRLTAWLCIAENMPSGNATRPNDVLRIRGGKTVEVLNTDAEGRLVMADGLVAASEENPDAIIDVATLTGAARVALGDRYTGAMGDTEFVSRVVEVAGSVGELLWPMPLPAELRPLLNSDVADIANIKAGNTAAGMLIAGVFLKDFVGTTGEGADAHPIPWAHLDIAGPAHNAGGGFGFTGPGPSGVTVRALVALAEDFSRA